MSRTDAEGRRSTSPPLLLPLSLPRASGLRPEHPAVIEPKGPGASLSYDQLDRLADHLARQLAALGVRPGDRVAALLPDGIRFVAIYHALPRLGAVLVPLNTRLSPAELAWQVEDAEPSVLVHEGAWSARLDAVPPGVQRVRYPAVDLDSIRTEGFLEADRGENEASTGTAAMPGLFDVEPAKGRKLLDALPIEAPRVIVYTSGTTGRPKGALLGHGNLIFSALGSGLRLGVLPEDRWLASLPLFHVGGMAILERSALQATTAVLPGRFRAEHVADLLRSASITQVSMVPTMLLRVMSIMEKAGQGPPSNLRTVLLGGGPISEALFVRALDQGWTVAPTYGLSEAASQVATAAPGMTGVDEAVAAPAMPFAEIAIEDERGRPTREADVVGQILVRGSTVMQGYWRQPEASAAALRGAWLHTGDLGVLDERGWLRPLGRRSDLVVSGGENVYPAEVEAMLAAHPNVEACIVLGLPDDEWGERVVAAVELVVGASLDEQSLETHLRSALAGYKIPRAFFAFDTLPRSAAGKVLRARVADAVKARIAAASS